MTTYVLPVIQCGGSSDGKVTRWEMQAEQLDTENFLIVWSDSFVYTFPFDRRRKEEPEIWLYPCSTIHNETGLEKLGFERKGEIDDYS